MKTVLDQIIFKAIKRRASDIHIEPRDEFVRIRFRVDGTLFDDEQIPKNQHLGILSAVKIMVDLDIAENRLPQDGACTMKHERKNFDLRISTVPTINGEKAVIRILERQRAQIELSQIGFNKEELDKYLRMVSKRSGMILITGPTGSGKTTTLYATLRILDHKENNIVTIEDPVEYKLPGINQIQVNTKAGLTFPKILRAVLRQDPDIILVGEIRDLETARIAVQAALTGHLILATIHTKDAPSSFTRLKELGIEEYLIKDVLIGAVAQRLVKIQPYGRKAIFEIMEGFKPQPGMKRLVDSGYDLGI